MIKIIAVGKIKESFYKEAICEYLKRISRYTKIEIIEVPDEPSEEKALRIEEERILKHIKDTDYVITLEIEGEVIKSLELATKIDKLMITKPNITFVIGGSYGLGNSIKERSNYRLSFSKLTFPHQLFRVVLLEQIYRIYKIINNESYHK